MEVFGNGQLEATWSAADAVRLTAVGEFDSANAADLETGILHALQAQARFVDFDLTAVTFIDSTGLEVLVRLQQQIDDRRGRLRMYPSLDIRRLLEITGLDEFFELEHAADAEANTGQPRPGDRDPGVRAS
jgi:stage II sporulation protein AA (anti-sigma F factor antagonist)